MWRPYLIKDILILERVQRRATKFILPNSKLDYRDRMLSLEILPLTMWQEITDNMFFVKQLKSPTDRFNIKENVTFSKINRAGHYYFNRLPRLWNSIPPLTSTYPFLLDVVKLSILLEPLSSGCLYSVRSAYRHTYSMIMFTSYL